MTRLLGGSEPGIKYVVWALIVGVFFGGLGGGVAFPTIPILGPILGISPALVGVILSANRFTRLVMSTPAGQVIDLMGTRRPMIAGLLVQGIVPFGYVLALDPGPIPLESSTIFLLSRAIWGVGSAFVFIGAFSTITHITTDDNRGKWIGYMRGGQSLGFPTGLVVGGVMIDLFGYVEAFLLAGTAGLFAVFVAAIVIPDINADVSGASSIRELPALVGTDVRIFTIGSVNFVVRFLFTGIILSTIVLYAEANEFAVGLLSGPGVGGVVMAVGIVGVSVTTLFVGRYSDTLTNRAALTIPALGVFALGFGVLALVQTLWTTFLGVALIGIGVGASNPPLLAYLGDLSPRDDVGKLGGVYNVFGDLGSTLGPLVALPMMAHWGFSVGYLACVGLIFLVVILVAMTLYDIG